MELIHKRNEIQALDAAAQACNDLLEQYAGSPILFLFSGGSSLKLLPKLNHIHFDNKLTFAPLDDRYSFDEKVNNFLQMMFLEGFYASAIESGCSFISTYPGHMQTMAEVADNFEVSLRKWKREYPEGIIVATIGMGPDGHAAGVMPYPEDHDSFAEFFEDKNRWVVGYDALDKNEFPLRITTTLAFMKEHVDHAVTFACGENKREAFKQLYADQGTLAQTPARILREIKDVQIFTDVEGAA